MASLAAIRASNAAFTHSSVHSPVAVFVGGTSGVGENMARAFAQHTNGNSSIILVGRNCAAADAILASLPVNAAKAGEKVVLAREFVQCDVTMMKNVRNAAQDILSRHPKINYLVMSPGVLTLSGRDETSEGIDKKMAVNYYARWNFLREMLPALKKAKDKGEDAAAMSVMAAGSGGDINVDDLALKKTYSVKNAGNYAPTYNDLMIESFSEIYPDLKIIHARPGIVRSPMLSSSPSPLIRLSSYIVTPLTWPWSVSPADCAEYMWSAIWKTADKPGAWRMKSNGESLGKERYFGSEIKRRKLWEHTEEALNAALELKESSLTD